VHAYVVAGPAGAGKSTLGEALARRTGAVLLDQDVLTNALLDGVFAGLLANAGHWNDEAHRDVVRPARYAALRDLAAAQVGLGHDVVLVAPFTAELHGGPDWVLLLDALDPAQVTTVVLTAPVEVLDGRLRHRADPRDGAIPTRPEVVPVVPHVSVDATLPTEDQLDLALRVD
jgi:mannitol-1-/sugar-/sorbitol-6-phosphatase